MSKNESEKMYRCDAINNILQWIQQSNTPCHQNVQVCGYRAGPQDNWLITQLINRTVNGTRLPQVSVMMEFELRDCDTTLNCQQTFNTHIYETSTEMARNSVNNYQQVQRVSPVDTSDNRIKNETIIIDFTTNRSSFYFAIQDETTCIVITRLIVFYTVCPAQTANLIHYPETPAPMASNLYEGLLNISVPATCIENAQPENGVAPIVTCSAEGIWGWPAMGCHCIRGLFRELVNDSETCNRKALIVLNINFFNVFMQYQHSYQL